MVLVITEPKTYLSAWLMCTMSLEHYKQQRKMFFQLLIVQITLQIFSKNYSKR